MATIIPIYYTGKVYRYFRSFKRVYRSEQGRGAKDFNNFLEHKRENCLYLVEMHVFYSVLIRFSRKTLAWSIWNSNNHIKEEQMLLFHLDYQNSLKDMK